MPFHRIRDPERLQALVGAMLLIEGDLDLTTVLQHIVEQAARLSDARYGAMGVLGRDPHRLEQFITVGIDEDGRRAIGSPPTGQGILGLLVHHPEPIRLSDLRDHPASEGIPPNHPPMGSFLGVPVRVGGEVFGNLYLCNKRGGAGFTDVDEDLVASLGLAAGLVIDKARLHQRMRGLTLVEERERIARNLHDTVIQQLFAAGLRLQGVATSENSSEVADRVTEVIDDLDETIRQIRTTIFGISRRRNDGPHGLRSELLALTDEAGGRLGLDVRVDLQGPIDAMVDDVEAEHLAYALREALSNVVRHASATRADVRVTVTDDDVELRVADNGKGIDPVTPGGGNGLANLRERAKLLRGGCRVGPRAEGGTELVWHARLRADRPADEGGDRP
ncbi:MAG: GAF domain-containing protein [Acidimicrobiales bacterium]|jgi:signal transduction histidine kinase